MTRRWFYSTQGQRQPHGPVDASALRELADAGHLQRQDLIWPEGSELGAAVPAEAALPFSNADAVGLLQTMRPAAQETYERAQAALQRWADLRINRPLVLSGDREALRRDVAIQSILLPLQRFGAAVVDSFWKDLEGLLQQRRGYYETLANAGYA